jgi:hypothetical protein
MEVDGCFLPSCLCQFFKLRLLLPKPLLALLYRFGDCTHHPAELVFFAQLALLCLWIILIFQILSIVGTSKIPQTVSASNCHLPKTLFWLSVRQSRDVSMLNIVLLLWNRCVCIVNSLSCPSSLSLNIILNPFHFLCIA